MQRRGHKGCMAREGEENEARMARMRREHKPCAAREGRKQEVRMAWEGKRCTEH